MGLQRIANGDIYPSRFVKTDTTAQGRILQAGDGDKIYGISGMGTDRPPLGALDTGKAAVAGEACTVFEAADANSPLAPLQIGSSGCTQGDRLQSDAVGRGIVTTSANVEIGAIAEVTAVAYQIVPVRMIFPTKL